jgi:hypothetical protein
MSDDIGDTGGGVPGTSGRTSKKIVHGGQNKAGTCSFQAIGPCPSGTLNQATGASRQENQRRASSPPECALPQVHPKLHRYQHPAVGG